MWMQIRRYFDHYMLVPTLWPNHIRISRPGAHARIGGRMIEHVTRELREGVGRYTVYVFGRKAAYCQGMRGCEYIEVNVDTIEKKLAIECAESRTWCCGCDWQHHCFETRQRLWNRKEGLMY